MGQAQVRLCRLKIGEAVLDSLLPAVCTLTSTRRWECEILATFAIMTPRDQML